MRALCSVGRRPSPCYCFAAVAAPAARARTPRATPLLPSTAPGPASSPGRRSLVLPSDCMSRQRRMSSWCPDSSTSGTRSPSPRPRPRNARAACNAGNRAARHERILRRRLRVVQHARPLPHDGVDQHQRRQLAARHDEIADRDLLVDLARDEALVDAFVPPRHQHVRRRLAPPPAPRRADASAARPPATGESSASPRIPPRAAPPAPPRAPSRAAPPASPSPVRRRTGGRRRSGSCPS